MTLEIIRLPRLLLLCWPTKRPKVKGARVDVGLPTPRGWTPILTPTPSCSCSYSLQDGNGHCAALATQSHRPAHQLDSWPATALFIQGTKPWTDLYFIITTIYSRLEILYQLFCVLDPILFFFQKTEIQKLLYRNR